MNKFYRSRYIKIFFVLLMVLFLSFCAKEKEDTKTEKKVSIKTEQANLIFNKLILQPTWDAVRETVDLQLSKIHSQVDSSVFSHLYKFAKTCYSDDSLSSAARSYFVANYNLKYNNDLLNWYSAPLYEKLHQDELKKLTEDDIKRTMEMANYSGVNSALKGRFEVFKSSIHKEDIDLAADIYIATFKNLMDVDRQFSGKAKNLKPKDIDFIVSVERRDFLKRFKEQKMFEKLYRLKNLSDEELRDYAEFINSAAGKWVTRLKLEAIKASVERAGSNYLSKSRRIK